MTDAISGVSSFHLFASMRDHSADVEFAPFKPLSSELHHIDRNYYKLLLDVIYQLQKVRLSEMFSRCIIVSKQIDGSCDRQIIDHSYVS